MITKCCCCFNLKYGFLAYGVLALGGRVTLMVLMYWLLELIDPDVILKNSYLLLSLTLGLGWLMVSSACLGLALKGIVKRRSILMYPFVIIMLFELITNVVYNIVMAIVVNPIFLVNILLQVVFNGYAWLCLISLYKRYRHEEKGISAEGLVKKI